MILRGKQSALFAHFIEWTVLMEMREARPTKRYGDIVPTTC